MLRTKGAPLGAMVPGGTATAGAGESHESTILLLGRACDDHLSVPDFRDRTERVGREGYVWPLAVLGRRLARLVTLWFGNSSMIHDNKRFLTGSQLVVISFLWRP